MTDEQKQNEAVRLLPEVLAMADRFTRVDKDRDDYRSAAAFALNQVLTKYDPLHPDIRDFHSFLFKAVNDRLIDERRRLEGTIGSARSTARHVDFEVFEGASGREDSRADNPVERAAARETAMRYAADLPSPIETARKVRKLRAAMVKAVDEADVTSVMRALVRRAETGDPTAVKALFALLGLSSPEPTPVIFNEEDI